MKRLFILLLAGMCGNPALMAQSDSIFPVMKYRTWVKPYKTGEKQVLFELKDSSVIVSNSTRKSDYPVGQYTVSNLAVKNITEITYAKKGRGYGILAGGVAGLAVGAVATVKYENYHADDEGKGFLNVFLAVFIPAATTGIGVVIGALVSGIKRTIPIDRSQTEYDRYKARLNDLGLKKEIPQLPFEIDGNTYHAAVYRGKAWMTENLRVTRYRNGDSIPELKDTLAWENVRSGARCWYRNDRMHTNKQGLIYNWQAVDDPRGMCPEGWHVATADEWSGLIECLDGNAPAPGRKNPLFGREYEFLFTGGYREKTGFFSRPPVYAQFWTSTSADTATARAIFIPNTANGITYPDTDRHSGLSVRCVRDW